MDALNKQLDTLKTIVPEEKETDEFIRLVQGAASASNVQLRRLTAQAIVSKEYHYEMPFEVQADGPYFNILDFFGRLSRLSRIINVGDLTFADPATKPPAVARKPGSQAAKSVPAAKHTAKKAAPKKAPKPAASASTKPAPEKEPKIARRDPFESLLGGGRSGGSKEPLPPGKAGLQVSTLRLDGVVRAPNGMIAVVSNPQARTYFLREGDQLYDGRVEKIAMDGVSFHEVGKDAFGKPVERHGNKRIYASAGEQQ